MGRTAERNRGASGRARRDTGRVGLTERALSSADEMQAAGRIARVDRLAFAWGWAEGFRAARRELGGGKRA